jgi:hypothetical protein
MRAHEFINEAEDAALKKELQKDWMPQGYIPSKENRGKNLTLPRDERGWPIEPGLEAPLISPEDIVLPFAGLGKKVVQGVTGLARNIGTRTAADAAAKSATVAPELAKDTVGKIKDIGYDLANKPHPYNPLTAKNIGREQGTAKYHADKAFRKEYGMEPPSYSNIDKEIQQFGGTGPYKQASKKYTDMSNDFLNRGYSMSPRSLPDIGTNVGAQVPTKISRGQPSFSSILDRLADKSLRTGALDPMVRSGVVSSARMAADTVADAERKKNEFIANQLKDLTTSREEKNQGKKNASK